MVPQRKPTCPVRWAATGTRPGPRWTPWTSASGSSASIRHRLAPHVDNQKQGFYRLSLSWDVYINNFKAMIVMNGVMRTSIYFEHILDRTGLNFKSLSLLFYYNIFLLRRRSCLPWNPCGTVPRWSSTTMFPIRAPRRIFTLRTTGTRQDHSLHSRTQIKANEYNSF